MKIPSIETNLLDYGGYGDSGGYGGYGKKKRDTGYYGYNEVNYGYNERHYGSQDTCPGFCGTIEDCFDLPCPTYGWRVKYTFTRNATDTGRNFDQLTERQTGEGFGSAAPADCRITAG